MTTKKQDRPYSRLLVSSIVLAALVVTFVYSVLQMAGVRYEDAIVWIESPYHAVMSVSLIVVMLYHGAMGMRFALKDYIKKDALRKKAIILIDITCLCLALVTVLAVTRWYV